MEFVTLSTKKFIKTKIPINERCKKYDEEFISKINAYLTAQGDVHQTNYNIKDILQIK